MPCYLTLTDNMTDEHFSAARSKSTPIEGMPTDLGRAAQSAQSAVRAPALGSDTNPAASRKMFSASTGSSGSV